MAGTRMSSCFLSLVIYYLLPLTIYGSQYFYEDLISLNANCTPLDTCNRKYLRSRILDDRNRHCYCDNDCPMYGDCCVDAKHVHRIPQLRQPWECKELRQFGSVLMKHVCPSSFTDKSVKDKCEKGVSIKDPVGHMPVTNVLNRITYRNVHCAVCNNAYQNSTFWYPRLECSTLTTYNKTYGNITEELISKKLVYSEQKESWGIQLDTFHACEIDPVIPEAVQNLVRYCSKELVKECPETWKDSFVRMGCHSYQALIYDKNGVRYYNPHCALCNGFSSIKTDSFMCELVTGRFNSILNGLTNFDPKAFAMLLDINGHSSRLGEVGKKRMCEGDGVVYDPFAKRCRNIICGFANYQLVDGKCVASENKSQDSTSHKNGTLKMQDTHGNLTKVKDFIGCPKLLIEKQEYMMLKNDSIFVPKYNLVFDVWSRSKQGAFVCSPFDNLSSIINKFSKQLGALTVIGLAVSLVCLLLHLIVFMCVPEVQNLSGFNLSALSLSLILAYAGYIAAQWEPVREVTSVCVSLGIGTYYFFLLSFIWMNIMAFDVWRTLRLAMSELRVTTGAQKRRFTVYTVYACILSSAVVAAPTIFDTYTDIIPTDFQPGFGLNKTCWFTRRKALIVFFAVPVAVVLILNSVFFILTAVIIRTATSKSIVPRQSATRRNYKLYLRLSSLMGFTWISGFFATLTDTIFLWYLFVLLNTLQGLFIFVSFSCNNKVLNSLRHRFKKPMTRVQTVSTGLLTTSSKQSSSFNSATNSTTHSTNSSMQHLN